ncbi:MAG: penicillin acylase family protein [Flavobacteriaceae bacterium]|nr:penicillin acylase family protein [Flavobacteriaceae bacterium]
MRILKKILKLLIILIILLSIGGWMYYNHLKPSYTGEVSLKNLTTETTVYYDDYGIPHIYAENEVDASIALGYAHAQDRLWQMELLKRIAPGRLSEIFGDTMLKNDTFFASIGIDEASEEALQNLDKNSEAYKIVEAYVNGVNQFIEEGPTPIEYTLVGVKKIPFEVKDVYNIVGYMAFSFAMAQKTDPLLSSLQHKLGNEYLKELNIDILPETQLIKTTQENIEIYKTMVASINDLIDKTPIPAFEGSNSWVLNANKTTTGNVIFANDPHIGFSQPAVWYEAHVVTPTYEMYGYYLAGFPFPLLGHNRELAYGLTMFENDDIDFYKEEVHTSEKGKYKTPKGYLDFETSEKIIKIKDKDDLKLTVNKSIHGAIINDVVDGVSENSPIAMNWIYTQGENKVLDAIYKISRAKEMKDVKEGASLIHAPGLNIMYGDAKGNVAWWASAQLYKHNENINTKFILDGATIEMDSIRYLDFNENPMAENPSWNYVYSANNQPDSIAGMLYPGYYLPEDRAKRIVQLLEPKNNWNVTSVSNMINDVTSSVSSEVIKEFTKEMRFDLFFKNEQRAIDILQLWDGSNTEDSVAPTIYNMWVYQYLKFTFMDEMGEDLFNQFNTTHLAKRVIADHIKKENSIWWDNILTPEKETRKVILAAALKEAVGRLEKQLGTDIKDWNWGKVHTLEHQHPLGTIESLRKYFNVGPFPMKGAREVIDNRGYLLNDEGIYTIKAGPSTRRIVDFSDVENSISILPTGQSGVFASKHYDDQAEMFNKGEFRKMKMNKEEIISVSTKLILMPKQ